MLIDCKDKTTICETDISKVVRDSKERSMFIAILVTRDESQLRQVDKECRWGRSDGVRTCRQWLPRDFDVLRPLIERMRVQGSDFLDKNAALADEVRRTFKQRVMQVENRCRITGVMNPIHLRASHCKPWRDSSNEERLNGENGLLLTPTVDHLFDRGFISFEDSGVVIVSPVAHAPSLHRMGIATDQVINVGTFTQGQKQFLDYHRESVLLQARH